MTMPRRSSGSAPRFYLVIVSLTAKWAHECGESLSRLLFVMHAEKAHDSARMYERRRSADPILRLRGAGSFESRWTLQLASLQGRRSKGTMAARLAQHLQWCGFPRQIRHDRWGH